MNLRCFDFLRIAAAAAWLIAANSPAPAQAQAPSQPQAPAAQSAPGYTLLIDGEIEPDFAPIVGRLAALFYESYPKLVARF